MEYLSGILHISTDIFCVGGVLKALFHKCHCFVHIFNEVSTACASNYVWISFMHSVIHYSM